jgi:hypothetical protein
MVHCLFKTQTGKPAAMDLGPCRAPIMAPLPQQKPRELRAAQGPHGVETRIASCPGIGNPCRRQHAGPMQRSRARRVGCYNRTVPPPSRTVASTPLGRACEPAAATALACSRSENIPASGCAQADFRNRHDDPVLMNIRPDIRDTTPQDPSPLHEARHRPIPVQPSPPAYCETDRPVLRRTYGLELSR